MLLFVRLYYSQSFLHYQSSHFVRWSCDFFLYFSFSALLLWLFTLWMLSSCTATRTLNAAIPIRSPTPTVMIPSSKHKNTESLVAGYLSKCCLQGSKDWPLITDSTECARHWARNCNGNIHESNQNLCKLPVTCSGLHKHFVHQVQKIHNNFLEAVFQPEQHFQL